MIIPLRLWVFCRRLAHCSLRPSGAYYTRKVLVSFCRQMAFCDTVGVDQR